MTNFEYWLWGIAEEADWYTRFPRCFWRRLLRHLDRKAGYGQNGNDMEVGDQESRCPADEGCLNTGSRLKPCEKCGGWLCQCDVIADRRGDYGVGIARDMAKEDLKVFRNAFCSCTNTKGEIKFNEPGRPLICTVCGKEIECS